jgi:hypothetical protein
LQQQPDGVQRYLDIKKLLADHFPGTMVKDPVQVDLFFQPAATDLSQKVTDTLLQRLERLAVLGTPGANTDLQTFKDQFQQRYDQREVPLMTALDSESGIGYGIVSGDHASYTPLIDDLVMPAGKAMALLTGTYIRNLYGSGSCRPSAAMPPLLRSVMRTWTNWLPGRTFRLCRLPFS